MIKAFILRPDANDNTHGAVSVREQRSFHRQHAGVDEALPGHEVEHPVHLLHTAHTHQPPNHDVHSAFLRGQHLLWKNKGGNK